MLEAVNSVISNAPFLRPTAEQASSARIVLDEVSASAPQAPYVSPYIQVNNDYNTAVLQIRDSDTGDVLTQFPSEQTLATRQRQAEAQRQIEEPVNQQQVDGSGQSSEQGASQSTNTYTEAQIVSSDYQTQAPSPTSRAPSADAVSAAIVSASQSGASAPSSGANVSVQA